ncbi:MAG: hypothetical protein AAF810_10930 [Cyanobacteria bacterium P01_D01_bin.36]
MRTFQAQIPDYLYEHMKAISKKENISIDMIVSMALSGHLTALLTTQYLGERAERGSWQSFQKVLAQVPDIDPEDYDRLD